MPPILVGLLAVVVFDGCVLVGTHIRESRHDEDAAGVVLGALLTLFGLVLGFCFSNAISHYEERVTLSIREANDLGNTWLRTAFLPEPLAEQARTALKQYGAARVRLQASNNSRITAQQAERDSSRLQTVLWQQVASISGTMRDTLTGSYAQSLNDLIDDQTSRREAEHRRLPIPVWIELFVLGALAHLLVGVRLQKDRHWLFLIPLVVGLALMLLADVDSPHQGWVRDDTPAVQHALDAMQKDAGGLQ